MLRWLEGQPTGLFGEEGGIGLPCSVGTKDGGGDCGAKRAEGVVYRKLFWLGLYSDWWQRFHPN